MSELESSNNQLPPPSPPNALIHQSDTQSYIRDPKFYYRDGSATFLAGNTLFKFQASLIEADVDVEDYEFKHIMNSICEGLENGTDRPGVDDAHPIVLPADIAPAQFRCLLTVVFGGFPHDGFLSFLKALRKSSSCGPLEVFKLVTIGYLACRFGMKRLDTWCQAQIYAILKSLMLSPHRQKDDWSARSILQLVKYIQSTIVTDYRYKLLHQMRHVISSLIQKTYEPNKEIPQGNIVQVCAELYKRKDVLINSPGFFGFIFAVIVSLRHKSDVWSKLLTREDRRVLYVAYATFTCLSDQEDLQLGWLTEPDAIQGLCASCSHTVKMGWQDAFGKYNGLKSSVPLEDIRHAVALAGYRYHLRMLGMAAVKSCGCDDKVLGTLQGHIESLYCGLTEKYKSLVEST
ncbi:unnamed protein product [Rhizoctonia solani]|uniref:BTB domain-containing protein n=1 Tax=Rhizoctonia solani TaxID=456999 RepID=A0A8H3AMA1_9AGAM|nr:unnamed protein product [Rhizoctonia solani]